MGFIVPLHFLLLNNPNVYHYDFMANIHVNPAVLRKILHHLFVSHAERYERSRYHSRKRLTRRARRFLQACVRWLVNNKMETNDAGEVLQAYADVGIQVINHRTFTHGFWLPLGKATMAVLADSGACDVLRYEDTFRDGSGIWQRGNLLHHCCNIPRQRCCSKNRRSVIVNIIEQVPRNEINALTEVADVFVVGARRHKKSALALALLAFNGDFNREIIQALLAKGVDPLQDMGGGSIPLFMLNALIGDSSGVCSRFWLDHAFLLISSNIVVEHTSAVSREKSRQPVTCKPSWKEKISWRDEIDSRSNTEAKLLA